MAGVYFLVLKVSSPYLQNDIESSKAAVLNVSKLEGPSVPKSSPVSLDDTEMKKLMEECKRLQSEVMKLGDENRQLKVLRESVKHRHSLLVLSVLILDVLE